VIFRLDNGLEVVMEENTRYRSWHFQAWVKIGSADEPQELAGIAHVFEHMLFKGDQAARRGSDRAGSGGLWWRDQRLDQPRRNRVPPGFGQSVFDAGLDILADTLQNASFDPAEFERERHVVLEEIKQGLDDPERQAGQGLFRAVFDQHPYGRPIIGTEATVGRLRREDLLAFFSKCYVASNLTVVVVGDFDPDSARQKITQAFSALSEGVPVASRPRQAEQSHCAWSPRRAT